MKGNMKLSNKQAHMLLTILQDSLVIREEDSVKINGVRINTFKMKYDNRVVLLEEIINQQSTETKDLLEDEDDNIIE